MPVYNSPGEKLMVTKTQLSSRFEQVFYNTGVGIMIVDKDRTLLEVNPKICEDLGYTKEELLGNNAVIMHVSKETLKSSESGHLIRFEKTRQSTWNTHSGRKTVRKSGFG